MLVIYSSSHWIFCDTVAEMEEGRQGDLPLGYGVWGGS